MDLQAQLTGRDHDERARSAGQRPGGVGGDAVQQRHTEGEGLAHTGAGLADQVVARQRHRQGLLLDGEGEFLALFGQRPDDLVTYSELGE